MVSEIQQQAKSPEHKIAGDNGAQDAAQQAKGNLQAEAGNLRQQNGNSLGDSTSTKAQEAVNKQFGALEIVGNFWNGAVSAAQATEKGIETAVEKVLGTGSGAKAADGSDTKNATTEKMTDDKGNISEHTTYAKDDHSHVDSQMGEIRGHTEVHNSDGTSYGFDDNGQGTLKVKCADGSTEYQYLNQSSALKDGDIGTLSNYKISQDGKTITERGVNGESKTITGQSPNDNTAAKTEQWTDGKGVTSQRSTYVQDDHSHVDAYMGEIRSHTAVKNSDGTSYSYDDNGRGTLKVQWANGSTEYQYLNPNSALKDNDIGTLSSYNMSPDGKTITEKGLNGESKTVNTELSKDNTSTKTEQWNDGQGHSAERVTKYDQNGKEVAEGGNKGGAIKFDSTEKQQLVKDAEEKYKSQPEKLTEFKSNMKALEDRADKDKLSAAEVAKTYKEVGRLMEAKGEGPLKQEQRQKLAEQVMKQAGHPYEINQGYHGTCAINNVVEVRTYTRSPSDAAKLVADVATTGQYTTKDGATIKIDPTPHGECTWSRTSDTSRTHASEIFQVTAANIRLDKENKSTNPPGQLKYEAYDAPPGSGRKDEAIVDYSKIDPSSGKPAYVQDDPGFYTSNDGKLRDIYQSITGVHETGIVVGADSYLTDTSDGCKRVHSESELNDYLAQCKTDGKFPVSISLDTTSEPFWSDSGNGTAGGSGGGHLLNVTDYHPGNPSTVEVQNSWGASTEHLGNKAITTHELYLAMDAPGNKAKDMKQDADNDRANGKPNQWKELEEARLEHVATGNSLKNEKDDVKKAAGNKANDDQFEQNVTKEMQQMQKDWTTNNPDSANRAKTMEKLNNMIASFMPDAKGRLQDEERKLGLN